MAETAGYVNQVWVLAGATAMAAGTGAKIQGVDNASYEDLCDMLDINSFGNQYKSKLAGQKDTKVSISGNIYVADTTGQDILIPGNTVFIGTLPSGVAVAGMQVKAIVESFARTYDAAGKQTFSCSFSAIAAPVALPART